MITKAETTQLLWGVVLAASALLLVLSIVQSRKATKQNKVERQQYYHALDSLGAEMTRLSDSVAKYQQRAQTASTEALEAQQRAERYRLEAQQHKNLQRDITQTIERSPAAVLDSLWTARVTGPGR